MSDGGGQATARAPRPALTRELPRTADLVVIGGGVIGAATALVLLVTVAGSLLPALRAIRVSPQAAMRGE